MTPLEKQILQLAEQRGPLTGSEILQATGEDGLLLWRTCKQSSALSLLTVGTRYLRLDRRIDGFARLSPSILREFLTYTVIGPSDDPASLLLRSQKIASHVEEVSRAKSQLAYTVVAALAARFEHALPLHEHVCFIIAGDIVYNMAHDVPRPERSTGKLVKGSDVDLVVIVDPFSKELMEKLDEAIYLEKSRLLRPSPRKDRLYRHDMNRSWNSSSSIPSGTWSPEILHEERPLRSEALIGSRMLRVASRLRPWRRYLSV
jgi:hypothetical protein